MNAKRIALVATLSLSALGGFAGAGCGGAPSSAEDGVTERTSQALNQAESDLILLAAKAIFHLSSTNGYASNFVSLLTRSCGNFQCSDKQVCQYLGLGASFPLDCSGLSDAPPTAMDRREAAFATLLTALPKPQSCIDWGRTLGTGVIIANPDGPVVDPLLARCIAEKKAQEDVLRAKKEEVLRALGFGPNGEVLPITPAGKPCPAGIGEGQTWTRKEDGSRCQATTFRCVGGSQQIISSRRIPNCIEP